MRLSRSSSSVSPVKKGRRRRNPSSFLSSSASSSASSSSSKSPRGRKKQKRLDAICEKAYNRNRLIGLESNGGNGEGGLDGGLLRRSTRVRRAPEVLDASPSPAKKRRRIESGGKVNLNGNNERSAGRKKKVDQGEKTPRISNLEDLVEPGNWKSRLRSRAGNVGVGVNVSRRGKRKLFDDSDEQVKEESIAESDGEMDGKMEDNEGEKSPVAALRKQGSYKTKGLTSLHTGNEEIVPSLSDEDGDEKAQNMDERLLSSDEQENLLLNKSVSGGDEMTDEDEETNELSEKEEATLNINGLKLDEEPIGIRDLEALEHNKEELQEAPHDVEEGHCEDASETVGLSMDGPNNGESCIDQVACWGGPDRKHIEDGNLVKEDILKQRSNDRLDKPRVREGRRCGLCGRGTDGRPPKRLVRDNAESDNERYDGLSSSDEFNYDIWDGFGDEASWLGRLLGPIHDRFGIAGVWVHQHCAVWSPEVYFAGLGHLKNVRAALYRGRALKCSRCGRPGATIGCRVDRCPKTYHLPCGRADRCIFDHRKFLIACPDHRYLFEPEGEQYTRRIKKLKAKKMKLELWKLAHDASRKDIESEEKWLENFGEDEEFLKREGKRLHRDLLRIAPVYIGGSSSESEKLYQGWESVAGLQEVIQCMKEVVLLPILYPEFFSDLGLTPPRGVLLHGYPGTGKTLVVRALIGSCARGDRRIAYFAQKGADCLGKYVGDAERQLRLLFQVAERSQPSIIFFDEIDGLAPCRTRQQDQTHNSVVSTLLALMDGLKSRGSVIVIGATNRPDAVDPALRRPGRFDREIYFPLPSVKDRAAILTLHTQRWPQPLSGSLLNWIAQNTAGFAGADLQALCTQAAMVALKRNCSLQELMSAAERKVVKHGHLHLPAFHVEEQDWLDALASAPPPCSRREAGMATNDVVASPLHAYLLIPCLLRPLSHLLVSLYLDERIWLPPSLYKAAKLIKHVLVSALKKMDKSSEHWWSHLPDLIKEADVARQIERCFHSLGLLIGPSTSSNFDAASDDDVVGNEKFELQKTSVGARSSLLRNGHHLLGRKSGFRIMISGYPKSGQRHLASCLLYGFVGHIEIQKVDLATISQEGHGDVIEGVTHILLKCASMGLCIIYMPRVDLWATEAQVQVGVKEDDYCASMDDSADTTELHAEKVASRAWTSFIEQADSMSFSSSLMILATSEVPIHHLPQRISQFFRDDSLNCNTSAASEHGTLRFIEQVDGSFDCDMMINSSAMELSHSLIQQCVQLIHCSSHFHMLREKVFDAAEGNLEDEVCNTLNGTQDDSADAVIFGTATSNSDASRTFSSSQQQAIGPELCPPCQTLSQREAQASLCYTQDAIPRILSTNRTSKGKSALLFAISSLGYQILRYPHFAELCWVTSKLKQGPCTVINGPWKGWPFNSCIIRPNNSLKKLSSTGNLKSKEHKSVVRGLVAVGILAYKGVYTSVRDVSLDVRKVLELLVGQINAKIIGGKDKYRFLRLLSQVAYLDDMVNSWAYSLQSLERDRQISLTNTGPKVVANQNISGPCDDLVGGDGCKPNTCPNSSHELSPQRLASECNKGIDPYEEVSVLHMPNSEARSYISEDASKQMVPLDPSSGLPMQSSSTSMDLLVSAVTEKTCNVLNDAEQFLSDHRTSAVVSDRDFVSSNLSNSSAVVVLPSENGVCRHDELDVIVNCSRKDGGRFRVPSMEEKECPSNKDVQAPCELDGDANDTSNKNVGVSAVSGLTCFYSFCSDCVNKIYILIRKILIHEKKKSGSCGAVDDVHDIVASCSANLTAAVRAIYDSESIKNLELVQEKLGVESYGQVCACEGVGHIQLNDASGQSSSLENSIFRPMMCSSHSENKSIKEKTNDCTDSPFGLGLNFLFRDGVLIPSDPGKDILFHCKFEKLCLRSLIERILVIKQPLG